jgi:hypothetical protein
MTGQDKKDMRTHQETLGGRYNAGQNYGSG